MRYRRGNDNAAVEAPLVNLMGQSQAGWDPKLSFLCAKHYLAKNSPRLYYHFPVLGQDAPQRRRSVTEGDIR